VAGKKEKDRKRREGEKGEKNTVEKRKYLRIVIRL
jgi:hypothetical protein